MAFQYVFSMSFTSVASVLSRLCASLAMSDWSIWSNLGKAFSMTGARTSLSSLSLNSYLRQMTWMTCTAPYTRAMSSVPR